MNLARSLSLTLIAIGAANRNQQVYAETAEHLVRFFPTIVIHSINSKFMIAIFILL